MGDNAPSSSDVTSPNPLAYLWAQASTVQSVQTLVSIALDFKASNYVKWHLFRVAVDKYALFDHLATAIPPADAEWLHLDSSMLRWLYGSIITDILDMVMMKDKTSCKVIAPSPITVTSKRWFL